MYKQAIPLSIPVIQGNEWKYVKDCLDSGWVSSAGDYVGKFERAIARLTGARYAVACINGTAALHISLILAGVKPGDEVLVPTVTFIAPVNAIKYVGAEPVFMDCDDFLNLDVEKTEEFISKECRSKNGQLINKKTGRRIKAVLPVHIFGHPAQMESLMKIANKYGLAVIEDATESLGSYYLKGGYKGRYTGTVGDFGCLSFNGNKIITSGGGGMILVADQAAAGRARYLTTQAKDDEVRYIHDNIGFNYRLTNIQAAVGVAQMEKLKGFISVKRRNFKIYNEAVRSIKGLRLIEEPSYGRSNYWFYSLVVEADRYGSSSEQLRRTLFRLGIHTRLLWHLNHLQRPYRNNQAYKIERAINYSRQVLNLPCSVNLAPQDIHEVVEVLEKNAGK